ncbi:HpcH/HpaI aldolase/citrate lyase family protein [Roseomonas sp. BN140053]|uniref:HpcH/HpaI aldolase/citrate lyase family protein n=1 Tax=Roseomonas sp. BN140053 TaxID=3391898 RepID=UPI0039E9B819
MTHRRRRSALYMPGNNARAIEKARGLDTDAVILDLEDAVAPAAKDAARQQVCDAVRAGGFGSREVVIRVNALDTPWGLDDLAAAAAAGPDAVLLPKVQRPADILAATRQLDAAGASPALRLWAMMETPRAMLEALPIADAAQQPGARLAVLVMGLNDLAKELRTRVTPDRAALLPWVATCLAAARANGLAILDGVFNAVNAPEAFRAECQQGRDLGLDGKTLIHPSQVAPCNAVFAPTAEELDWARAVVAAFADPAQAAAGVLQLDGRMVERLHLEMAERILGLEG